MNVNGTYTSSHVFADVTSRFVDMNDTLATLREDVFRARCAVSLLNDPMPLDEQLRQVSLTLLNVMDQLAAASNMIGK